MRYEDFRALYPNVPGSDLCPICTNRKCRFIYSEAQKDLPPGAVATKTNYKPCAKPGKGGTGEDISKKTFMAVFECPSFEYNLKHERDDTIGRPKKVFEHSEDSFKDLVFKIG